MTLHRNRLAILTALFLAVLCGALSAAAGEKAEKIHKVEGDVQKPVRIHGPAPAYPADAKEERIEGAVVAKTVINQRGEVEDVEIVQSASEVFDQVVLDTLREWRFEPAKLDGEPVSVYYTLTINFRLDKDGADKPDETAP